MKPLLLLPFIFFTFETTNTDSKWGQIGHYVTGYIAEQHLSEETREKVESIIGDRTIPLATVWMDDIRSDSKYDYTSTWHWVTIPDGMTYQEAEKNPDGDVIWALETMIEELKNGGLSPEDEREKLMMVMHLVADVHQPHHVGSGLDRGGNDVRVQWMGQNSNIHRVWDSDIINSLQMSYTEIARELLHNADEQQLHHWKSSTVRDWAMESVGYREDVYDLPDNQRIGYEYRYYKKDLVFQRLLQAGVRMADLLEDIYGS